MWQTSKTNYVVLFCRVGHSDLVLWEPITIFEGHIVMKF